MNNIETLPVPYSIRVPGRLAEVDADGYQIMLVAIDPAGVGHTEAEMLDLAQRDAIHMRYNESSALHNAMGLVSIGVKVA